jgi:MoxR-like ATPase
MRAARETVAATQPGSGRCSRKWPRHRGPEAAARQAADRLLTNGHVLLEGVPGLAKTLALKTLAGCIAVRFKRLQFTPDMLPADIVGTMIYNPQDGAFRTKHGPIFQQSHSRG